LVPVETTAPDGSSDRGRLTVAIVMALSLAKCEEKPESEHHGTIRPEESALINAG